MKCPVCNAPMNSLICGCGNDASRDYGKYPAFGTVRDVLPFSVLRSRPTPKNALVCEKCGSAAFSIAVPEGTRRCAKCGWSPDEAPRLECGCGSVYFTARLSDGALLCPLCGKAVSLEDYLKRVRPKISSPQLHVPPEVPAAPRSSPILRKRLASPPSPPEAPTPWSFTPTAGSGPPATTARASAMYSAGPASLPSPRAISTRWA